ncbi:MAG: SDR family NAD(P)-dependent oxidoreductase [Chitinophagaceae bacterium]
MKKAGNQRLSGKVMIVYGGSNPVAMGVLRYLLAEDAVVIAPSESSHDIQLQKEYVSDIETGRLITLLTDMPVYEKYEEINEGIIEQYGHIDMMVALFDGLRPVAGLLDAETTSWQQVTDQMTVYYSCGRLILRLMRRLQKGTFVCISNAANLLPNAHNALSNVGGAAISEMSRLFYKELQNTPVKFHHLLINNVDIHDKSERPAAHAGWINPWMVGDYVMKLYEGTAEAPDMLFHGLLGKTLPETGKQLTIHKAGINNRKEV